jgi:cytoskeletal protein RodZ
MGEVDAEDPAPPRVGESYEPPNLSLLPEPLLRAALLIVAVPLLIVLVLAIHPWTFGSSPDSPDPSYSSNGPNNDYGDGSYPTTDAVTDTDTYSDTTTDTTGSGDPAAEADAVTSLLNQAKTDRATVAGAVSDAANCGNLSGDVSALQNAKADRQNLAQQAGNLSVDLLDGASGVPQLLSTALTDSATADDDFAKWVIDLQQSCSPADATGDQNYAGAESASQTAESDKQNLLNVWNPIAQQYSQPTWSTSDI